MKKIVPSLVLVAYTSLNAMMPVQQDFDADFDAMRTYFDSLSKNVLSSQNYKNAINKFMSYPSMDIYNEKDQYVVKVELPGMDKDNIKVTLDDNKKLIIDGEKHSFIKDTNATVVSQESYFGKFHKEMMLPNDADPDKVDVSFDNGILTIKIQKLPHTDTTKVLPIK